MSVSNGGQTLCHMIRPSKVSNTFNGLRAASLFSVCEGPRSLGGSDALGICPAFLRAYVPGYVPNKRSGKVGVLCQGQGNVREFWTMLWTNLI